MYEKEDFHRALTTLQGGGIILYPTDTVWGLGCDARQERAVRRLFELKRRADAKAMLCLVDVPGRISSYVTEVPEMAWNLIEFATRPLTIIYPGARNVAPSLIADDGSLGIRVCEDKFCQELVARLHAPIVSTSANISGEPAAKSFADVTPEIINGVDYVVRYRQEEEVEATPSSIIKLGLHNEIKIIRE
ncbi:MAG: threonylcarbamoyl-AMP synthase [Paludibacteraceae bacterium]|nr:threonylcarbamoyl-AMP synthase [Paludibacteraceae bacterium]